MFRSSSATPALSSLLPPTSANHSSISLPSDFVDRAPPRPVSPPPCRIRLLLSRRYPSLPRPSQPGPLLARLFLPVSHSYRPPPSFPRHPSAAVRRPRA